MREILFRGKRDDNGEWVVSNCIMQFHGVKFAPRLWAIGDGWVEVIPETVGEFTGLTDKNGTEIFEGDIVRTLAPCYIDKYIKGVVEFGEYSTSYQSSNVGYYVNWSLNKNIAIYCKINDIEIIGNIHDNPELLTAAEADQKAD